jgi:hypothetical protein
MKPAVPRCRVLAEGRSVVALALTLVVTEAAA